MTHKNTAAAPWLVGAFKMQSEFSDNLGDKEKIEIGLKRDRGRQSFVKQIREFVETYEH